MSYIPFNKNDYSLYFLDNKEKVEKLDFFPFSRNEVDWSQPFYITDLNYSISQKSIKKQVFLVTQDNFKFNLFYPLDSENILYDDGYDLFICKVEIRDNAVFILSLEKYEEYEVTKDYTSCNFKKIDLNFFDSIMIIGVIVFLSLAMLIGGIFLYIYYLYTLYQSQKNKNAEIDQKNQQISI